MIAPTSASSNNSPNQIEDASETTPNEVSNSENVQIETEEQMVVLLQLQHMEQN